MTASTDPLDVLIGQVISRLRETTERLVRDDIRLLGADPDLIIREGRPLERITVIWQHTDPMTESIRKLDRAAFTPSEMYRGLMLDDEIVIDHLWQLPGAERNRMRFVYFGYESNRRQFAHEHSIDPRRVLHWRNADQEMRGRRERFMPVFDAPEAFFDQAGWRVNEITDLVHHVNHINGFRRLNTYGN